MTLSARVTLVVIAAVAVVLAAVGASLVAAVDAREHDATDRELRAAATRLAQPARRAIIAPRLPMLALRTAAGGVAVRVVGRGGDVVYDDGRAPGLPGPAMTGVATVASSSGDPWRVLVRPVRRGSLEVASPLRPVDARIAGLRRDVIIAAVLGLLACALAVRVLTSRALQPLHKLRASAARVSTTRDLTTRLDADGPPEVADVAASLNAMLSRLEDSAQATHRALDAARRFTADAGHELRTPLTSQKANLAVLARDDLSPQERASVLNELEAGQLRLAALLDALQALARGDAALPGRREAVDLVDLADAALADAKRRHPAVTFAWGDARGGAIEGDPAGLRAAIDNLLENAARHGARRVEIAVEDTSVIVDDDGPGIPPEERERVFERFARGRRTAAPGSGLGLAVVAQQAELHGGRAQARTSPQGGARMILSTWDDPARPRARTGEGDDRAVSGDRAGADDVGDPPPG